MEAGWLGVTVTATLMEATGRLCVTVAATLMEAGWLGVRQYAICCFAQSSLSSYRCQAATSRGASLCPAGHCGRCREPAQRKTRTWNSAGHEPAQRKTRQAMDRPSSLDTATHQGNSYLRPGSLGFVRLIGTSPFKRRKPISKPGQAGFVSFSGRLGVGEDHRARSGVNRVVGLGSRSVGLSFASVVNSWSFGRRLYHSVPTEETADFTSCFRAGEVPTALTLLFWWWLTVSSVFVIGSAWDVLVIGTCPPPPPPS